MRALYLHVDKIWYKTVKPALKNPPDPPGEASIGEALAVFVTIERGDDESVVAEAAEDLRVHLERIKAPRVVLYPYAHLSSSLAPPREAHRLLLKLEEAVRGLGVEVHRAPFGWYKAFELRCKGHPLAELSRSFTGARGEGWEQWLSRWGKDELEAFDRLGFRGVKGLQALASLAAHVAGAGAQLAGGTQGAVTLDEAYRACAESGAGGPGDQWLSVLKARGEPRALLEELSGELGGLLTEEDGFTVYRPRGARLAGGGCLGPLMGAVLAAIHAELSAAGKGKTPTLPVWLTPLQAVVIPVSDELGGYAGEVASILAAAGLRVEVWRGGGLGRRVREAGRRWVPLVAVVGEREAETRTVTLRRRWEPGKQETVTLEELRGEAEKLALQDPARRP